MDTILFTFTPTDNTQTLDFDWQVKPLINKVKESIRKADQSFIFDTCTLSNHFLNIDYDECFSLHHAIHDILITKTGVKNIYDITEIACDKDDEWTKKRNIGYNSEVYVKYTFKPEYAKIIQDQCSIWLQELESLYTKVMADKEAEKQAQAKRQAQFVIVKAYEHVNPKGGEDGIDGYYDADISDGTNTIRFVARNVFDFGFYTYPKHFEGTDDIFNSEKWTELEHKVGNWLTEFSPFTTGIRM